MSGIRSAPVRILHVLDSLGNGGLENGVVNLVNRMDPRQFEHCICTVREKGVNLERLPIDRVDVVHLGRRDGLHFPLELRRVIREQKPDVVHSRNWGTTEAALAARLAGSCAVVHSEHGLEASSTTPEPWRRRGFRRLVFELADRVLCVSKELRELHARRTGFPKHRITVIHNGVDSRRFCPDPAARARVRRELGIDENDFCIGCVGNLLPVKGHEILLRALGDLGTVGNGWHLLVAGEGFKRPELESMAAALSQRGIRPLFLGRSNDVPALLNAFDVYVLPSLNEGISNSLLEAMATGLPVIASNVGGTPEVVEDGASGMLFPVGDTTRLMEQLTRLYTQTQLRRNLGAVARRRIMGEFSIDSMVQNYERFYRSLSPAAASVAVEMGA